MKTFEEIKKGLECCVPYEEDESCGECPYKGEGNSKETCYERKTADTLAYIEQLKRERDAVIEAFRSVVWYDGHKGWLMRLVEDIEKAEGNVNSPFGVDEWHSEKRAIWMLLCGMYGDWGSSIRSGWIDKKTEAAAFIRSICDTQEVE